MFTRKTSLIIPTRNRSDQIIALLNKLIQLNLKFNEIIVIDSSNIFHSKKIKRECKKKKICYYQTKPSTAYQRNFGLEKVKNNTFIMFMDDDVILLDDTFLKMDKCVKKYEHTNSIGGFGFNQIEDTKYSFLENLKKSKIVKIFDIYPSIPGKIAKSGWHSKIINLKNDTIGDWVFTTMCIYKFADIRGLKFDETFGQYSYLEDLDFSLNLLRSNKKIFLSSKSKFKHPRNIDRSSFKFGIIEIINRYKIIKKHKLSKKLFYIASSLRFFMSLLKSTSLNKKYFLRSLGNIYGFFLLK
jgi:glycosyltransferase involved in cell wall biosynthesis